jgi:hypothetical protein
MVADRRCNWCWPVRSNCQASRSRGGHPSVRGCHARDRERPQKGRCRIHRRKWRRCRRPSAQSKTLVPHAMMLGGNGSVRQIGLSNKLVLSQHADLIPRKSKLGEHIVGLLAEFRGRATIVLGVRDSVTGWPARRMWRSSAYDCVSGDAQITSASWNIWSIAWSRSKVSARSNFGSSSVLQMPDALKAR